MADEIRQAMAGFQGEIEMTVVVVFPKIRMIRVKAGFGEMVAGNLQAEDHRTGMVDHPADHVVATGFGTPPYL